MRIAVVDVGTNTTRLYAAVIDAGKVTEELTRISRVTRLGAGVDASGRLAEESLAREYAVLEDYRRQLDELCPDRAIAVMTSAVRDAENGADFAREVQSRYGLETHILTGDEEARLTYMGATDVLTASQDASPTLVFDIGGGSTELVIGHAHKLDFHVSTQAGVVRQADRHITADPPTPQEMDAVAGDVRQILEAAVPPERRSGVTRALGVAGTPTSLAAIAQGLEPYDPSRVHGYRLSAAERDAIFTRLASMPLPERQQVPGLHPDRAIAIIPGIVILKVIMDLFGLPEVEVSEHDILRGSAIHYAAPG
jgi:exopolyphosphatase/guanosine-5'-triphosphate,3'-diphosphate pyrophosphatase